MRLARVAPALLLVVFACQADSPLAPLDAPTFAISDGSTDGNPHFFFLPPIAPELTYSGTFDASLSPVVRITEDGATLVELTPTVEDDHYHANWRTKDFALDPSKAYRISVLVEGIELGFIDVQVVASGLALVAVGEGGFQAVRGNTYLVHHPGGRHRSQVSKVRVLDVCDVTLGNLAHLLRRHTTQLLDELLQGLQLTPMQISLAEEISLLSVALIFEIVIHDPTLRVVSQGRSTDSLSL